MLPPILFDAGYYVEKTKFFRNTTTIFIFAVLGTFVSALTFAAALYIISHMFFLYDLTVLDSLIFGSLISATDPVATLGIFHAMAVDDSI